MATVTITEEAQQQLQTLPLSIQVRIEKIFVRLQRWPAVSGAKPLSGKLAGHYRIRTGDYRVQFRVEHGAANDNVIVEKLGHRDGFYGE